MRCLLYTGIMGLSAETNANGTSITLCKDGAAAILTLGSSVASFAVF